MNIGSVSIADYLVAEVWLHACRRAAVTWDVEQCRIPMLCYQLFVGIPVSLSRTCVLICSTTVILSFFHSSGPACVMQKLRVSISS